MAGRETEKCGEGAAGRVGVFAQALDEAAGGGAASASENGGGGAHPDLPDERRISRLRRVAQESVSVLAEDREARRRVMKSHFLAFLELYREWECAKEEHEEEYDEGWPRMDDAKYARSFREAERLGAEVAGRIECATSEDAERMQEEAKERRAAAERRYVEMRGKVSAAVARLFPEGGLPEGGLPKGLADSHPAAREYEAADVGVWMFAGQRYFMAARSGMYASAGADAAGEMKFASLDYEAAVERHAEAAKRLLAEIEPADGGAAKE